MSDNTSVGSKLAANIPIPQLFFPWVMWPASSSINRRRHSPWHSSSFAASLFFILLLISGLHPNPGPPPPPAKSVISWNCNGIRNSSFELASFLSLHQVKVACLQETHLDDKARMPSFPGYAVVRQDRPTGGGGGLVTLVHLSLSYIQLGA